MQTRGPKSGGPEDPNQFPKGTQDLTHLDNLIAKLTGQLDAQANRPSFVNPNYVSTVVDRGKYGSSGSVFPKVPGSSPVVAPVGGQILPSGSLGAYNAKPEQLADMSEKSAIASRQSAFVRAYRYSQKIYGQSLQYSDQSQGTQYSSDWRQATTHAHRAYIDASDALTKSRISKDVWKKYNATKDPNDLIAAQQASATANKARDLHEQSSNFAALYFRNIAQKGLGAGTPTQGNGGNNGWFRNWNNGGGSNGPNGPGGSSGGGGWPGGGGSGGGGGNNFHNVSISSMSISSAIFNHVNSAGGGGGPPNNPNNPNNPKNPSNPRNRRGNQFLRRSIMRSYKAMIKQQNQAQAHMRRMATRAAKNARMLKFKALARVGVAAVGLQQAASGNVAGLARTAAWASGNPAIILGTELALAAKTAANALSNLTEQTFEANKQFSHYSGTLAYAYADYGVHEFQRKFQYASGTADTGKQLVDAVTKMRNSWLKFDIDTGNATNAVSTAWASFSGGFGKGSGENWSGVSRTITKIAGGKPTLDVAEEAGSYFATLFSPWGGFGLSPITGTAKWLWDKYTKVDPTKDMLTTPVGDAMTRMFRREATGPLLPSGARDLTVPRWPGRIPGAGPV